MSDILERVKETGKDVGNGNLVSSLKILETSSPNETLHGHVINTPLTNKKSILNILAISHGAEELRAKLHRGTDDLSGCDHAQCEAKEALERGKAKLSQGAEDTKEALSKRTEDAQKKASEILEATNKEAAKISGDLKVPPLPRKLLSSTLCGLRLLSDIYYLLYSAPTPFV
jgi:hypothetical protein